MQEFIVTYTGKTFFPLAARIEDLDLLDIAHALSMKCRWGGHTNRFYSVAEHSIRVAALVEPRWKLWALLHDAGEAYLPDICRPIKQRVSLLVGAEARILDLVAQKFNLPAPEPIGTGLAMPTQVSEADDLMLGVEAFQLMNGRDNPELQRLADWSHAELRRRGGSGSVDLRSAQLTAHGARQVFLQQVQALVAGEVAP